MLRIALIVFANEMKRFSDTRTPQNCELCMSSGWLSTSCRSAIPSLAIVRAARFRS